ncbi:MAG: hypothetical protein KBS82_05655 [Oscillospiraceae bacterium]|nr:hypothetical protein [Candidatus Limimonas egerieequi]
MYIKYDALNRYEQPQLTLCNPGSVYSTTDGTLNNIVGIFNTVDDFEAVYNFNAISEINFTLPYPDKDNCEECEIDMYKAVQNRRLIFVDDVGYFLISNVEDVYSNGLQTKSVSAQSCEAEIQNKKVPYIADGTYRFLTNPLTPQNKGILNTLVESLPMWTVDHIDASVASKFRTFEDVSEDLNILGFMLENLQDAYECIFTFNCITRTISVYDQDNYVNKTDIHITKDDVINSLNITENADDLYTAITVLGDENITINAVNPMGTNTIYNFDQYIDWMAEDLRDRVTSWKEDIEDVEEDYLDLNLEYYTKLEERSNIQQDIDVIDTQINMYSRCRDNIVASSGFTYVEEYNAVIAALGGDEVEIDIVGISTTAQTTVPISVDKSTFVKNVGKSFYGDKVFKYTSGVWKDENNADVVLTDYGITFQGTPVANDTITVTRTPKEIADVFDTIDLKIINLQNQKTDKQDDLSELDVELQELNEDISDIRNSVNILKRFIDVNVSTTSLTISGLTIDRDDFESAVDDDFFDTLTFTYNGTSETWIRQDSMDVGEDLNDYGIDYSGSPTNGDTISVSRNRDSLDELMNYIYEGSYTDEYVVITDVMTYSDRFDQMKILYDRAKIQLKKISSPTQQFSVDSENFIFAKEFEEWTSQLETGCLINVELDRDDVAELFLTNITVNYEDCNLSLTFGNRFNRFDTKALFEDVLGNISKSSNSISFIKDQIYPIKSGEFDQVKEAIQNSRDITMGMALSANTEEVVIDGSGYTGKSKNENGEYDPHQVKIIGKSMVFTDDAWETCKTAVGLFQYTNPDTLDVESRYGINAEVLIGDVILGRNLVIYNSDGQELFSAVDGKITSSVSAESERLTNDYVERISTVQEENDGLRKRINIITSGNENDDTTNTVNHVETTTGFTFDENGLKINKSTDEIENLINNRGMYITRTTDDEEILRADVDGVNALNLTSRKYLIVGDYSRFENFNNGTDSRRTACYFIDN